MPKRFIIFSVTYHFSDDRLCACHCVVALFSVCVCVCCHLAVVLLARSLDFGRFSEMFQFAPIFNHLCWLHIEVFRQKFFIKDVIALDLIIRKFELHKCLWHTPTQLALLKNSEAGGRRGDGKSEIFNAARVLCIFEYLLAFKSTANGIRFMHVRCRCEFYTSKCKFLIRTSYSMQSN